jgi:hypothetical protein
LGLIAGALLVAVPGRADNADMYPNPIAPANPKASLPRDNYTVDFCSVDLEIRGGKVSDSDVDANDANAIRAKKHGALAKAWTDGCEDPAIAPAIPANPYVEATSHPVSRAQAMDTNWAKFKDQWLAKTYDGAKGARALALQLKSKVKDTETTAAIDEFIEATDAIKGPMQLRVDMKREACFEAAIELKATVTALAAFPHDGESKDLYQPLLDAITAFSDGVPGSGSSPRIPGVKDMRQIGRCWNIITEMDALARSSQLCKKQKAVLGNADVCTQSSEERDQNRDTVQRFARDCQEIARRAGVQGSL